MIWPTMPGWVSVGIDHDTANFAANAIRRWWKDHGKETLSSKRQRLDDHSGRRRQQRLPRAAVESGLQQLADALEAEITVCHFPPGTSKWNKIEHRLF